MRSLVSTPVPLARRARMAISVALALGALLGAAAWAADVLDYPWNVVIPANAIGAWALVAFVAGAIGWSVIGGAARGLIALVTAVIVYYLGYALFGDGWRSASAVRAAMVWGSLAVLAGPALGFAGGVWRHGPPSWRALAVGVPSGILVVEGWLSRSQIGNDPFATSFLVAEVVVGAALPIVAARGGPRLLALGAAALVALATIIGLVVVIPGLRSAASTF
jgi:hypothetical protein